MSAAAQHITAGYRNYIRFAGRAARAEYWIFAGFLTLGVVVLFVLSPMLAGLFALGSALPGLSAATRRLHDSGRAGWWLALPALIVAGWLLVWMASAAAALAVREDPLDDERYFLAASAVMLIAVGVTTYWLTLPSQPGPNKYGPNPHEVPQ